MLFNLRILNKISLLYPNSEFRSGIFFEVDYPHIIHNDDDFSFPLNYKAFNIPLRYDGDQEPRLVFFDQVYLEGPSKFFNKESNIETYYNKLESIHYVKPNELLKEFKNLLITKTFSKIQGFF